MRHRWMLSLACAAALAPAVPGHAQLTSRSHIVAPQYEVLWRSKATAGQTFFSMWMRNLQGSDPANPGTAYDLFGTTEDGGWESWVIYGPMFGFNDGPFATQWWTFGVRGGATIHGNVHGMGDTYGHYHSFPDGTYWTGTQFYTAWPQPTYLFGCDVPEWAFETFVHWEDGGYYQTCNPGGNPGWFTLEWANAGTWTLNDLHVEGTHGVAPTEISVSPEPGTLALLGTGLAGLVGAARRRRRRREQPVG